jgi:NAD+ diphosphatase
VPIIPELPLARFAVDRGAALRSDPEWAQRAFASASTRVLVVAEHAVPVTDELSLVLVPPTALGITAEQFADNLVLLGSDDDHVYVAVVNDAATIDAPVWAHIRQIGAALSAFDIGLAVTAIAMSQWHATHRHCTRCGQPTAPIQGGWARRCPGDGSEHYPRTEPAMIVAVEDAAGRILLGQRAGWTTGWFSTLAGFVEAGETVEACVVREVLEESGCRVDPASLRYMGSQPWPYPASLMLGYRATALTTEIEHDESEMAQVRWFSRDEFVAECEAGTLRIPNRVAIAWHLIRDWYGEDLPAHWSRD